MKLSGIHYNFHVTWKEEVKPAILAEMEDKYSNVVNGPVRQRLIYKDLGADRQRLVDEWEFTTRERD